MKLYEISGYYGCQHTPTNVFVYGNSDGSSWYVCEGSVNVNKTFDPISDGCDVELLSDVDCFTWDGGIISVDDLAYALEY